MSILSSKVCTCGCVVLLLCVDDHTFVMRFPFREFHQECIILGVFMCGRVWCVNAGLYISPCHGVCVWFCVCAVLCVCGSVCVRSGPALHWLLQTHLAARRHDRQPVVHVVADEVTHTLKPVVLCAHLRTHKHIRAVSCSDYNGRNSFSVRSDRPHGNTGQGRCTRRRS